LLEHLKPCELKRIVDNGHFINFVFVDKSCFGLTTFFVVLRLFKFLATDGQSIISYMVARRHEKRFFNGVFALLTDSSLRDASISFM